MNTLIAAMTIDQIESLCRSYKRGIITIEQAAARIVVVAGSELSKSADELVEAGVPVINDFFAV